MTLPHPDPLVVILASRISLYVKEKYGARLDGASWDTRNRLRFLNAETEIMLREQGETVDEADLVLAVADAVELIWPSPGAKVIDLDAFRERRRGLR
jgi:hypothetical protein